MNIVLSNQTDDPIYQQIYDQICSQILSGALPGDSALPPIRTVAKDLRISVITVKRAWEELERGGFIYTIAGKGCFIAPHRARVLADKRARLAEDALRRQLPYYRSLGLDREEFLRLAERLYDK